MFQSAVSSQRRPHARRCWECAVGVSPPQAQGPSTLASGRYAMSDGNSSFAHSPPINCRAGGYKGKHACLHGRTGVHGGESRGGWVAEPPRAVSSTPQPRPQQHESRRSRLRTRRRGESVMGLGFPGTRPCAPRPCPLRGGVPAAANERDGCTRAGGPLHGSFSTAVAAFLLAQIKSVQGT